MSLIDQFGRKHSYLRISLTDRCNLRCLYCMPKEGLQWQPSSSHLQNTEIIRLAKIFTNLGIEHIRLTGGEPTLRKNLVELVSALAKLPKLKDLSLTTNGVLLPKLAKPLYDAGLKRLNISIDSLQEHRFNQITRSSDFHRVIQGIETSISTGFSPIKLNIVLLKDHNGDEIFDFIDFCAQRPTSTELRFIEYMPFNARWLKCLSIRDIQQQLKLKYQLVPLEKKSHQGPAQNFLIPEKNVRIGFISPLSNRFCSSCNRIRLMADGSLRSCLAKENHPPLRDFLRQGHSDLEIQRLIQSIVWNKVDGHHCTEDSGTPFEGTMTQIGG